MARWRPAGWAQEVDDGAFFSATSPPPQEHEMLSGVEFRAHDTPISINRRDLLTFRVTGFVEGIDCFVGRLHLQGGVAMCSLFLKYVAEQLTQDTTV